jgi:hypothetical protein
MCIYGWREGSARQRGRHAFVTVEETPDGGTTYPDGKPAKCERCGIVPEFVIKVVEWVVDAAEALL